MYDLATPLMQPERLPQFLSTPLFLLYLCLCPEKLLLWTHKYEQRVYQKVQRPEQNNHTTT